jgi:methyl-accepting chemotaxis protein
MKSVKQILLDLSMSRKLLVAPLAVTTFMLIFGLTAYLGLAKQKTALNDIYNNRFKAYQTSEDIHGDLQDVHTNIYRLMSWAVAKYDSAKLDALGDKQLKTMEHGIEVIKKTIDAKGTTEEEKKILETLLRQADDYRKAATSAIDLASSDINFATMYMGTADEKFQAMEKTFGELRDLENRLSEEQYKASEQASGKVLASLVIVLLVAVALSFLASMYMSSLIVKPLNQAVETANRLAKGDMEVQIETESSDEIGKLLIAMKHMVAKLRQIIRQINSLTGSLASSSEELSATTDTLDKGTKEQARQTEQVVTAMTEVSQTIMDMAKNATESANASREASKAAAGGKKKVEETVAAMHQVSENVKGTAATIDQLGKSSQQIENIARTISGIADQTNLLALNAAIEAARAGEQGRGFAVVADEVRQLAERTAKATKDITEIIHAILQETEQSVKSMNSGVEEVGKGVVMVEEARVELENIVKASNTSADMIQRIAAATEQQSAASEEVSQNMESIAAVTRTAEQSAGQIKVSAQDLAKAAVELREAVGWFHMNGSASVTKK